MREMANEQHLKRAIAHVADAISKVAQAAALIDARHPGRVQALVGMALTCQNPGDALIQAESALRRALAELEVIDG
jgi:hypothetical protein